MPKSKGTILNNRYQIDEILGQGGMGAVYRAVDEHLHILVAVKENLFLTEEYSRQFQAEARILAGLRHPNLPHVTDYFGVEGQGQYLVMDYIEGEDLRKRMERVGSLPERDVLLIGISICDALAYMHSRKHPIVHRDIKPGNIKVTAEGKAVLVDFGLAKIMQRGQVTSTGARAMTPGYSPPEQYGTARTDPRSDIYSLGATLYAALTGSIPEDGLARMTGKTKLTPIRDILPRANRKLVEVIEMALEVDPDDRFQTAEEFKKALIESGELSAVYQERPTIPPPPETAENEGVLHDMEAEEASPAYRARSRKRKQRMRTAMIGVPALLVLLVAGSVAAALNPALAQSVLGYFAARPTATGMATEVSALDTASPTDPTHQPSETLSAEAINPVLQTPTATAEETPLPTLTPTITPLPTATPLGGGRGQVAFASDRNGVFQIWLMNADGKTPARQLTNMESGACQATWSPDGMAMAYISPCPPPGKLDAYPGSNIYVSRFDAEMKEIERSQVTSSLEGDFDPAWSPDGTRIAFTSLRSGKSSIFVLDFRDNSITQLSELKYQDKQPAWSPSGMEIIFVRQLFATTQIWKMSDNGQVQSPFAVSGAVINLWPSWSADAQVIFYSQIQNSRDSVPVLMYKRYEDRDKQVESRIPARPTGKDGPYFGVKASPDGYWLVYESWPDGINHDIYVMNLNGSNQQRLTTDPGFDFGPVWRPIPSASN